MGAVSQTPAVVSELAATPALRETLQFFARDRQWINERHIELCRIAAPTFLEQARAEWMVANLRDLGWDARIDRAGNVVAHFGPNGSAPYVALTAHLDTVLAPRKAEDVAVDSDGTLRGPGVSDNGAGLAALLAIAKAVRLAPELARGPKSLLLVANVGEEGEGNLSGMRFLCKQSALAAKIRSYLVLDGPKLDHITAQALASRRFDVVFRGPGGHSWSDFGFGNPVHALARAITHFVETRNVSPPDGPRCSFNFGAIDGGTSINSIPVSARAKLDLRSEDMAKLDEAAQALKISVEQALQLENERASGGKLAAKLKEIGSRPGGRLSEDAAIVRHVRAVDAHLGIRSQLDCASTDANIPLSLGIQAVSIGAGGQGGGAHSPSEWYHPDGRELGLRRILLTLAMLLREN